jgi:hypothetical protein
MAICRAATAFFGPELGFQPRYGGVGRQECRNVTAEQQSRGVRATGSFRQKYSDPAYLRCFFAGAVAGALGATAEAAVSSGALAIVKI